LDTTVAKGMSVLELLARSSGPMRLSVIAEQLGLQKSNVHRLLATLTELGYVSQETETSRYMLTLRIWELGAAIIAAHPAKRAAGPYMQELHRATAETVSLTVLDGDEVLYLDKIVAPRPLRFTTQPGSRAPAALTASGKAMLAHDPDPRAIVERSVKAAPPGKPINADTVMEELADIRAKGYAITHSSWTPGVVSIAAAILGRDGRAAAALTVSGPAERLHEAKVEEVVEAVLNACAGIAETVGRI